MTEPIAPRTGPLDAHEREGTVAQLEQSLAMVREAVEGWNDAQWRWRPAPEAWSALEVVAHLALVETRLRTMLESLVPAPPPEPETYPGQRGAFIGRMLRSRERRVKAPDGLGLPDPLPAPADALAALAAARAWTVAFARESPLPLHDLGHAHFRLGFLTGHHWLLFLAAHAERHAAQVVEVRSAPGFPA
ncbi:MAG: DinB family protein [Gemmatimonadales bacterium]|nr:DinB family protein [Gemmatimonadales bacterium]